MVTLTYGNLSIEIPKGQTVLSALLEAGVDAPNSCREGVCQTCIHKVIEGTVPERAQLGLSEAQKTAGYFLACVCSPTESITIISAGELHGRVRVRTEEITWLSSSVIRLRLKPVQRFDYRPGQFLALTAPGDITRNYSIASHPKQDDFIELHLRIIPDGKMSEYVANKLAPHAELEISSPSGTCFYEGIKPEEPIVLAGTGTGLAPLWGILHDAIESKHQGPIILYHGARTQEGLYLVEELQALEECITNLTYRNSVMSNPTSPNGGDLAMTVLTTETDFRNTNFFLCGDSGFVTNLKRELFMKGAELKKIRADVFLPANKQ